MRAKATSALCRAVSLPRRGLTPKLIPGAEGMVGGDGHIGRRLCERTNGQLEARKQAMTDAAPKVMVPQHVFQ